MRILGVDTALANASVALVDDGELLTEEILGTAKEVNGGAMRQLQGNHAEIILPLIELVLRNARITLADLSGIAVSIGPGSFTGLRIGLATVKGIAYDWRVPVVGISTLRANAARVTNFDGLICSLLDAHKGEVYMSLFRRSGENLARITTDTVTSINCAIDAMHNHHSCAADGASLLVIGDGAKTYEKLLSDAFGATALLSASENYPSVASGIAMIAHSRMITQSVEDVGTLAPVYLRRPAAETKNNQSNLLKILAETSLTKIIA